MFWTGILNSHDGDGRRFNNLQSFIISKEREKLSDPLLHEDLSASIHPFNPLEAIGFNRCAHGGQSLVGGCRMIPQQEEIEEKDWEIDKQNESIWVSGNRRFLVEIIKYLIMAVQRNALFFPYSSNISEHLQYFFSTDEYDGEVGLQTWS